AAAAPLAAGALLPVAAVMNGPDVCPLHVATGVPCPLCGATRAFVLFGHGDARWLEFGAVWVVAALVLLAVAWRWQPGLRTLAAVGAVAWAFALT
ncbi:MAG TPA: DUF2752 domain-containing protein, partial [Thermoleophilaceae bacterium]|nr:DUF2752 domain-containing protein [Thermoleophilaceae bacterium]